MKHLVMFDIDGTLTQTNEVDNRCFVQALTTVLGVIDIDTEWTNYRNITDAGIAAEVFERHFRRSATSHELAVVRDRFITLLQADLNRDPTLCCEVPGAVVILGELVESSDFTISLATGCWCESAELKLRKAGLYRENIPLASSSDAPSRQEIMAIALDRAASLQGISSFDSVVYVGDAIWDLKAATSLGYGFVGIGYGERAERLRLEGAEWVLADFTNRDLFYEVIDQVERHKTKCHDVKWTELEV
jgi:phosphoglycolate phosphatase-like HAD superfamily hydrolase